MVPVVLTPDEVVRRTKSRIGSATGIVPFAFSMPVLSDEGAGKFCECSAPHHCEDEQVVVVPPFLVFPLRTVMSVEARWRRLEWTGELSHPTYWVEGAILTHFPDQEPDPALYRGGNVREAVCLITQHPRFGSVRIHDGIELYEPVIEACRWNGNFSLHRCAPNSYCFPGEHHHRLWIPRSEVPAASEFSTLKLQQ